MIRIVGGSLLMIRSTEGENPMTLTIATRWQITFRVQPLARVTMPTTASLPTPKRPDLLAIAQGRRLHEEMEARRFHWEKEAMLSCRRMF
jgi:hypothetical protein